MGISLIAIPYTEAVNALGDNPPEDVKDRLRVAMKATWNHWMVTDEGDQLSAAVSAVIFSYPKDDPMRQRLLDETEGIGKVNAMIHAAQVGLVIDPESLTVPETEPVGILPIWFEVKKG